MKYLNTLLLLLLVLIPLGAMGAKRNFADFENKSSYAYTYISDVMLKAMSGRAIGDKGGLGLDMQASDLSSIEILESPRGLKDDDLWTAIRALKEKEKMQTLSTKKSGKRRFDILGTTARGGQTVKSLLIVDQSSNGRVKVIYMTGNIPLQRFDNIMVP